MLGAARAGWRGLAEASTKTSSVSVIESSFLADKEANPFRDCWKFDQQRYNWTMKEVEHYSLAYSLGLLEMGLRPGDKVVSWLTCKDFAESQVLYLACARAGIQVMQVAKDDVQSALQDAKGLVFSPWHMLGEEYRVDKVLELVPELSTTHHGSELHAKAFPALKHVLQTGHSTIRGTLKFKQVPVFAKVERTSSVKPTLDINNDLPQFVFNGSSFTQQQLVEKARELVEKLKLSRGDTLMSAISHKFSLTQAVAVAGLTSGVRAVFTGKTDAMRSAHMQHPKALVICGGRVELIKQGGEVENLVVAAGNQETVESVAKKLKDNYSVTYKSVIGVNPTTLQYL